VVTTATYGTDVMAVFLRSYVSLDVLSVRIKSLAYDRNIKE